MQMGLAGRWEIGEASDEDGNDDADWRGVSGRIIWPASATSAQTAELVLKAMNSAETGVDQTIRASRMARIPFLLPACLLVCFGCKALGSFLRSSWATVRRKRGSFSRSL
jgi:hypothetical protein